MNLDALAGRDDMLAKAEEACFRSRSCAAGWIRSRP